MTWFRGLLTVLLCALFAWQDASAQQRIGGVVNDYTPVRSIRVQDCQAYVTVDNGAAFTRGSLVVIIQMKGPITSGQYDVSAVGRFEFATVDTVTGNILRLTHPLLNTYDVRGRVQCVRVPVYPDVIVSFPLTASPWNGTVGGVVAIDVRGTLRLDAPVDATGLGYRGGTIWVSGGTCSTMTDNDGANSAFAAMKGETYVDPLPTQIAGRQALFSGGGGGCAHNSGGGGGGNAGNGGRGGAQWEGCGAYVNNGGGGGIAAALVSGTRPLARPGGGGGSGHMNNTSGTSGVSGGGIVIIRCATLNGNGQAIRANGASQTTDAGNDAAGGGGAGGTIVLETSSLTSGVFIEANGGNGGDVNTGALHGPGGGGGGGAFIWAAASPFAGLAYSTRGGANGQNVVRTAIAERNYLAERGADGQTVFGRGIPEYAEDVPPLIVRAPADTIVCPGTVLNLVAQTSGQYATIEWRTLSGTVVSTTPSVRTTAQTTTTFIVRIVDANGCSATDSVFVGVGTGWRIDFPPVRRTMAPCERTVDDALWLYNNSPLPATITRVSARTPGVTVTFAGPVRVDPGQRLRIPVSVTMPVNSTAFIGEVEALVTPCDTLAIASFIVTRQPASFAVDPTTITMPSLTSCSDITVDTTVTIRFSGDTVDVVDVIEEGAVRYQFMRQFRPLPGVPYGIPLQWTPTRGATSGRIGFVVMNGSCLDTLWVTIDGRNIRPQITAPADITVPTFTLCANPWVDVTIPIRSPDTTQWTIADVRIDGPATTSITPGTRFTSSLDVTARITPSTAGPFTVTVRVLLRPCDSTVVITLRGSCVDTAMLSTDLLVYSERVIGRPETLQAVVENTGTVDLSIRSISVPGRPFTLVSTQPTVPCTLPPGARLTADIRLLQEFGVHRDSIVVDVDAPCPTRRVTVLEAEATALTRLWIPDVAGEIGVRDTVVVLLTKIPEIDRSLLTTYTCTIAWTSADCDVRAGSDARGAWSVARRADTTEVTITGTWDGTDTMAVIPVTPLLSPNVVTDLRFIREPGFVWTGQRSDVEYDDGILTVNDPCAGRDLRSVRIGGMAAVSVAPHPVRDVLHLRIADGQHHNVHLELFDVLGARVWGAQDVVQREARFNIGSVSPGWYVLQVQAGSERRTMTIVIE